MAIRSMKKYPYTSLLLLLVVLSLLQPAYTQSMKIISKPDPPPKGIVGSYYKVTFTTNTGYIMDRWESSPENPVPGLRFSKMDHVASITLSGEPTKAGTFTFTLKAYYKRELVAQRSFTIRIGTTHRPPLRPFTFNISMIQLIPALVMLDKFSPQDIYVGQEVLFVFWTDHPHAETITWNGINSLPGTSFSVWSVGKLQAYLQRNYPRLLDVEELQPVLRLKPDTPILVMKGNASRACTCRVSVEARDPSGRLKTGVWILRVHEPTCGISLSIDPSEILWNTTNYLFSFSEITRSRVNKSLRIRVRVVLGSYVGELSGNITFYPPEGFEVYPPPGEVGAGLSIRKRVFSLRSDTRARHTVYVDDEVRIKMDPCRTSAPYPGKVYWMRVKVYLNFGERVIHTQKSVKIVVFHNAPEITITDFQPVSQLPNPYHYLVWWGDVYRVEKNLIVLGKQATFRFNYTLNSPYPVLVGIRITLPKSDWEWQTPIEGVFQEISLPSGQHPYCEANAWCIETEDNYILYEEFVLDPTSSSKMRFFLYEKIAGIKGKWFPKPKSIPAHATLELVRVGRIGQGDPSLFPIEEQSGVSWDIEFPAEVTIRATFNSPVTRLGGLKLGYFIMDQDWFTQQQIDEIHDNFPEAVKRYLEALFPIVVKEVRFMRYVSRPHVTGFSTKASWAWDADTWGEWIGEANLDRGVMIVPDDALDWASAAGMVMYCGICRGNDAQKIAIVEYAQVRDNGNYLYMPVVAHELSHTFGFPDIYYGKNFPRDHCTTCKYYGEASDRTSSSACTGTPEVLGYYAYFDEVEGGILYIGGRGVRDIMACCNKRHWVYHSWWSVARDCMDKDPPDGLLISLIVFKNGTVTGRPFSRLYNHSYSFLSTKGVGETYIVLRDREGAILRRYPMNISYVLLGLEPIELEVIPIVSVVEWFDNLGRIEFIGPDGKVWFARDVSPNSPRVKIRFPLERLRLEAGASYVFSWSGEDKDGDKLLFNVHLKREDERSWFIIAHRIAGNSINFTIPRDFELGNYVLMVKATDGVNTGYQLVRVEVVSEAPSYRVEVRSNIGVEVPGSGVYKEGTNVTLEAPPIVRMPGLLGMLGGKYVFERWAGFVESEDNPVSLIVYAKEETLEIEAVYVEDLSTVYLVLIAIAVFILLLVSLVFIALKRRKSSSLGKS